MPIRSLGLLQARVPIYVSARSCKPAKPRPTPSANSFFTDRSCNSSPLLINTPHDHLHLNQLPNPETAFNIHTSQADHRDRGKRLRLPSCLLIETASNDAPAHPVAPCSRRFRCRLATIRPPLREQTIPGSVSALDCWRQLRARIAAAPLAYRGEFSYSLSVTVRRADEQAYGSRPRHFGSTGS